MLGDFVDIEGVSWDTFGFSTDVSLGLEQSKETDDLTETDLCCKESIFDRSDGLFGARIWGPGDGALSLGFRPESRL